MKYIINENQSKKHELIIKLLRRTNEDWPLIEQIVEEGTDIDDPCDFINEHLYLKRICVDSARTYLFHYIDESFGEQFKILLNFYTEFIRKKLGTDIVEYYHEKKEDCE